MNGTCSFDKTCTRANCRYHHTGTESGKSPEAEKCRYRFECTRKKCPFVHDTVDGRSPLAAEVVGEGERMMTGVGVCTWNILSDTLAGKMVSYHADVLDTENRWTLLSTKLGEWMAKGFLLCLQEVTKDEGLPRLEALSVIYAYRVVYESHGSESNGFMGNAVLVPPRYHPENVRPIRIGAVCTLPAAQGFPHLLLSVLLRDSESEQRFVVATYHMPCQYKRPEVLEAHCVAIQKIIFLSKYPVVLAGDFNMLPELMAVQFDVKMLEGTEPTTHSRVRGQTFQGRLDHILWSSPLELEEEIPVCGTVDLMPNATQPSDHECVAAVFGTCV